MAYGRVWLWILIVALLLLLVGVITYELTRARPNGVPVWVWIILAIGVLALIVAIIIYVIQEGVINHKYQCILKKMAEEHAVAEKAMVANAMITGPASDCGAAPAPVAVHHTSTQAHCPSVRQVVEAAAPAPVPVAAAAGSVQLAAVPSSARVGHRLPCGLGSLSPGNY